MEVTSTQLKHCDLVKINGRIDSYTAPQLADAFNAILAARRYKIVFDMNQLEFMSTAGLRVLITTQKACRRYNRGEIVLCNVPTRILETIKLAGLTPLFKIFDDPIVAVGYF